MNKTDYHIHADFSADSRIKLAELIPHAISQGFTELAITEHLDLSPREITVFGMPSLTKYQTTIKRYQSKYPQIKLHCGIEVGDFQDVVQYAVPLLDEIHFDLVLGSVHFIKDRINVAVPMKELLSVKDITEYYEKNLALVSTCPIDVLAHLGVYKRYYQATPDESHCLSIITQIFETMIKKGIALEINYSALRRTYQHLHPETDQLALYKKLGGRLITIGSDSHKLEQLGDYFPLAYAEMQKFGFEHLQIKA